MDFTVADNYQELNKNGQYHRYYPCVNLKFFNLPHVFYQAVKFYRMGLALPFSCILNVVYCNGVLSY